MKQSINMSLQLGMLVLIAIAITACSSKVTEVDVPLKLPPAFSQTGTAQLTEKWWHDFDDPRLNQLIDQALNNNFSLQSSWDRLNQARAVYKKSSSDFFPTLDGGAEGNHRAVESNGTTVKTDYLSLGLTAQYEVDLWGKISSTADAAKLDFEATAYDLDAAAMTLAAEVASTWYTLVEQNREILLLDEQIIINKKALELISTQFKTGQVPLADVLQQRQLVESKTGEKIKLVALRAQTQTQLTILLGQTPGTTSYNNLPEKFTLLPPLPETGIPAQTILERPDVRRTLYKVEAADKRVAAAVADRFPALRFTGVLETSGNYTSDLFSNYLASIAGNLIGPIIDGGKRKAEVERTSAVASEELHNYAQTILVAVGEVEDALISEKQQQLYINSLQAQLKLAEQTMEQVKQRYLKGVENYERVLSALTSLQSLEQSKLIAQKTLLINRIELCRALGSGWKYSQSKNNS